MPLIIPANSITGGYDVANSLRFNDGSSDYLSRSYSSAGNQKTFTISFWVKRTTLGASQRLFGNYSSANLGVVANFNADDTLQFYNRNTSTGDKALGTNRKFRDSSAFYNIVITVDSTNGTAADRMKIFINGSRETSLSFEYQAPLNYVFQVNDNVTHYIGQRGNSTQYTDGYMSEFVVIDGQALDPTSFGEFDADSGIWKPIDVSGLTFGTNGFYLDFEDSGALGADVSGNGNNFTVNNLTAIDQTTDTPTNNFCTLNPLDVCDADGRTLSNGNLDFNTSSGNNGDISGTLAASSGKWYFETKILAQSGTASSAAKYGIVGVKDINLCSFSAGDAYYIYSDGRKEDGATATSSVTPGYSTNDIVQVALDLDGGNIYFGLNGDWGNNAGSFNQTFANATAFFTSISTSKFWTPYLNKNVTADNVLTLSANFGNPTFTGTDQSDGNSRGSFEYAPPSGYLSLCTSNLSEVLG
jgi:hypothetical protein